MNVLEYSILAIIVGLVLVFIRWWAFKKKLSGMALAKAVANDVVKAVEQTGKDLNSSQKKELAVGMLQGILKSQGLNLDV
jgi:hypothetical protein